MKTGYIEYQDQGVDLQAYFAVPEGDGPYPIILVGHDWSGRNDFATKSADYVAKLGYAAVAIDMYGKGVVAETIDDKQRLLMPLLEDRSFLQRRAKCGLEAAKTVEKGNISFVAGMGFCFGGVVMLDLARMGEDLKSVVTFHASLAKPGNLTEQKIKTKILTLHGHDDPMVPPEQVLGFEEEMTKAQADWQMHVFGHTYHSFMTPKAKETDLGMVYNALAAERSWKYMENFFKETL